jgi:hypothetical protein
MTSKATNKGLQEARGLAAGILREQDTQPPEAVGPRTVCRSQDRLRRPSQEVRRETASGERFSAPSSIPPGIYFTNPCCIAA